VTAAVGAIFTTVTSLSEPWLAFLLLGVFGMVAGLTLLPARALVLSLPGPKAHVARRQAAHDVLAGLTGYQTDLTTWPDREDSFSADWIAGWDERRPALATDSRYDDAIEATNVAFSHIAVVASLPKQLGFRPQHQAALEWVTAAIARLTAAVRADR